MVTRVLETAVEALALSGRRLVVAVSGGVDSVVLLRALVDLAPRHDIELVVGHVNHGLRGAESEADEDWVRGFAGDLGLSFATARVEPGALREGTTNRSRPTVQEAARSLRYAALQQMSEERSADYVATAHHADDQAETVLLRILRGCGPDGLAGIAEVSNPRRLVRPLLRASRLEILDYAGEMGLEWREDSSNRSLRYARNRLRHDWLPGLAREFNPQLLRTVAHLAEAQKRDSEWLESLVAEESKRFLVESESGLRLPRRGWKELPEALVWRLARRAFQQVGEGRDLSRVHLERMVSFLGTARGGTVLELPQGLQLVCSADEFTLQRVGGSGAGRRGCEVKD